MMTSSTGNVYRVTCPLWGESTGHWWIPLTKGTVTRIFDVFFDLRPNKRLSKQSRRRWFETPSRSLWRHCDAKWAFSRTISATIRPWSPVQILIKLTIQTRLKLCNYWSFVLEIHQSPMDSLYKWPVLQKMLHIMTLSWHNSQCLRALSLTVFPQPLMVQEVPTAASELGMQMARADPPDRFKLVSNSNKAMSFSKVLESYCVWVMTRDTVLSCRVEGFNFRLVVPAIML